MTETPKGKTIMEQWPQLAMMALASAIVGGGTSFGVTQNAASHPETSQVRELERELAAVKTDVSVLRAQLDFMVRGEVNFLTSRSVVAPMMAAPPAFDIMEDVSPPDE